MLERIRPILQEVSASQSLNEAVDIVVQRVHSAMNVDVCSCYLLDTEREHYVLMGTKGLHTQSIGLSFKPTQGLVGLVGLREEPINLDDAAQHPNFLYLPETGEERFSSFLGVPMIHARKVLGVLVVQQKEARRFNEEEEAFVITISAQLAGLIAHALATRSIDWQEASLDEQSTHPPKHHLSGIPGSPGVGLGHAVVVYPTANLNAIPNRKASSKSQEIKRFREALENTRRELSEISDRLKHILPPEELALFDAYQRILDSNSIGKEVVAKIREGQWAQGALRHVIQSHTQTFEQMEDPYLSERAADLKDLGLRVLGYLQSAKKKDFEYPDNTILVGEEITAAQMAEIPKQKLSGIVSKKGSKNSHVAILARAMDIPIVLGVEDLPLSQIEDTYMIVDGYSGQLFISPSDAVREEFLALQEEERELKVDLAQIRSLPAETLDGYRVPLYINVGLVGENHKSLSIGSEGVGLFRSEWPFMAQDHFPTEEAQYLIYRTWLEAFAPKHVTIRTLDIGGDKSLSYFSCEEDNPFLGWRGVRVSLDHPEIFLVQIRAMLRASEGLDNLKILLPMVTSLIEIDAAKRLIERAYQELITEGHLVKMPEIGAMIEVPSAVYLAAEFAKKLDFLSVGSNDLTQYLLAVDRNNPRVADLYDGLHPAMLHALKQTVAGAHSVQKPISVCGEMAGDPVSVILLVAMGFDALSMNATSLPRIKWVVRNFSLTESIELLNKAMQMHDSNDIRTMIAEALTDAGLGGLVRAGKH